MTNNIKSALNSIWTNKIRSILTVLGVVIGVTSVTTLISLGQGLKNEVSNLVQGFGTNVIMVIGGKIDMKSASSSGGMFGGATNNVNPADFLTGTILTRQDVNTIKALSNIEAVAPMSLVPGKITFENQEISPMIMGTSPDIIQAFQVLSLDSGELFKSENDTGTIVIGPLTSDALFGEGADPLGNKVTINKTEFTIIGKLSNAKFSNLFGSEFDNLVLMSMADATKFSNNTEKIMRIAVKAENNADVKQVKEDIKNALLANREDAEQNFSVFTQDDLLGLMDDLLNLTTALVSAIAGISLVVGGIVIMNIMLVTVTERTREIGLRKALGATQLAILTQFLTEAVVITLLGGIIGLGLSIAAGMVVSAKTPLTPEISPLVILIAIGLSTLVGVVFGIWPAMRAAQKDPIDALRYE